MALDYLSIQIGVSIVFTIIGVLIYTMMRFYWKKESVSNLNEFFKTLDVGLIVDELKFNPKFWKTAAVSAGIAVIVVMLSYADVVAIIIPNESIMITAAKSLALGMAMNLGINTIAGGGQLSGIIQAILAAFITNQSKAEGIVVAKRVLEAKQIGVTVTDPEAQSLLKQESHSGIKNPIVT